MKVLKFGAVWCPGCLVMKPRWKEIEQEMPWLETQYFEYDDSLELAKRYDVTEDLPVFIFLDRDGNELLRLKGEVSKEELVRILSEHKDR